MIDNFIKNHHLWLIVITTQYLFIKLGRLFLRVQKSDGTKKYFHCAIFIKNDGSPFNSTFPSFSSLKIFLRTSVIFVGPLIPLLWTSSDIHLGSQSPWILAFLPNCAQWRDGCPTHFWFYTYPTSRLLGFNLSSGILTLKGEYTNMAAVDLLLWSLTKRSLSWNLFWMKIL